MAEQDVNEVDTTDLIEDAHTKSLHLHSMLTTISGEGGEVFRRMDHGVQDNYIWACRCLAEEVTNIIEIANRSYLTKRVTSSEVQHG